MRRRCALVVSLVALLQWGAAGAQPPLVALAVSGQPAPGGGVFERFRAESQPVVVTVNASGAVAWFAPLGRAPASEGLFLASQGRLLRLAADGTGASGGGTLSGFGRHPVPAINAVGAVAFAAAVTGGATVEGIFVATRGRLAAVARAGSVAPGISGGTLGTLEAPAINDRGDVVFLATVRKGRETREAIYLGSAGRLTKIAAQGDPAPDGGAFAAFGPPVIARRGAVAFAALIEGPAAPGGIFVADGARVSAVAVAGGATPVGGIYARFSERIGMNGGGAVAFSAVLKDAPTPAALFVADTRGTKKMVALGEAAPGGGSFSNFGPWSTISDAGAVGFTASIDGGPSPIGVFVAGSDGLFRIAGVGDRLPTGGTLQSFGLYPMAAIGPAGHVAFATAATPAGGGDEGIFVARCVSSCRSADTR